MITDFPGLVDAARAGQKRAIARLVTYFEDDRAPAAEVRQQILAALDATTTPAGRVIGVTGAPGVGKSTLVGELAQRLIADPAERVAVLAVDPSSPMSGGALLGDRTRVRFPPDERRLYFRSQASAAALGGVAPTTPQVCRLLLRLFSTVLVETVGIGQSEIEVAHTVDSTFLIVQPHGGDHVQFMKAGVMEVPDAIVVSKGDLGDAASATYHALCSQLRLAAAGVERPVYMTSARSGLGLDSLVAAVRAVPASGLVGTEPYWFEQWVAREYGRNGRRRLTEVASSTAAYLARYRGLDSAQVAFAALW